jgi:hypothetical protein
MNAMLNFSRTCRAALEGCCGWALLVSGLILQLAAARANAASELSREYHSFKIVSERNIFNANRSGKTAQSRDENRKPNRIDSLTLVGTMSYEKGFYAFFDGSSSDYKKVLEPGKVIAGYQIGAVTGGGVRLQAGTNTVELRVGMQLRREEEGAWQLLGGESAQPRANGSPGSEASESSSSGDEDDLVKKLMQQREQEFK